jgi:hypothetical protein
VLYITAGALALMGLVYLFSPTIMPYHQRYIGMKHRELDPAVAQLMLFMMKDMGLGFLAAAVCIFMLVRVPFRKREPWAWWTILVVALVVFAPLLWITLSIGLYTPWWSVLLGLVAVLAALLVYGIPGRNR